MAEGETKKSRSRSVTEGGNATTPTSSHQRSRSAGGAAINNGSGSNNISGTSTSSSGNSSSVNMMRIYTKTGDTGTASLYSSERRSKTDECFAALGDIDELSASVGHAAELMKLFPPAGGPGTEYTVLHQLADIQSR
jgi:hypothetical protein